MGRGLYEVAQVGMGEPEFDDETRTARYSIHWGMIKVMVVLPAKMG